MNNELQYQQGHSYLVSYKINGALSLCRIKVLVLTDTHILIEWPEGTTSRKDLQGFKFQYKIVEEIG